MDGRGRPSLTGQSSLRGLSSAHCYGGLAYTHVLHAHRRIPFEHLFVGVFGLVSRRVPVEGVEHTGFWVFLTIDWKDVMHKARGRTTYERYVFQSLFQVVEQWNRNFEDAV